MAESTLSTDTRLAELLLGREIEQFLYREADLLDERRFEEWLDLFADDLTYWMPLRRNVKYGEWEREQSREEDEANWFAEGKATLTKRVQQIRTGVHWAEEPVSRHSHLVTNIRLVEVTPSFEAPTEVKVRCRFLVYRNRLEMETDLFVGRREDTLRRTDAGWQIVRRVLLLDQNVAMAKNFTVFF